VDTGCQLIQEVLIEVEGETSRLSQAELRHLDSCASCRALADAERRLVGLLAAMVPPADRTIEQAVMRAVRARDRRLVSLIPVAASLLTALVGLAAVGGVPGGSLLATVPFWSSKGWLTVAVVYVVSAVATAIGALSIVAATRRWRTLSPWRIRA
jgi:predicted anti-sigma-YlaC factor YlaD